VKPLDVFHAVRRPLMVLAAALLMAFDLNTFVHAGGLIPGGFTGLTLLIQEICLRYGGVHVPFSPINYVLNAIPAAVCFRFIGKRFALYSCLMIVVCGLLTDWMPVFAVTEGIIEAIQLHDTLLAAVFGGILNAVAISLCLHADATSGGTDFIAIFLSERYRRDSWNYIFAGNCVILAVAGALFSLDKALYSIIFQFVTTAGLNSFYHGYHQRTLLIITARPDEISAHIYAKTRQGATSFDGVGHYNKAKRTLLYSVVYANEVTAIIKEIKELDPKAFVNVIQTEMIKGEFYRRPKD